MSEFRENVQYVFVSVVQGTTPTINLPIKDRHRRSVQARFENGSFRTTDARIGETLRNMLDPEHPTFSAALSQTIREIDESSVQAVIQQHMRARQQTTGSLAHSGALHSGATGAAIGRLSLQEMLDLGHVSYQDMQVAIDKYNAENAGIKGAHLAETGAVPSVVTEPNTSGADLSTLNPEAQAVIKRDAEARAALKGQLTSKLSQVPAQVKGE